jgi:hypothetical protein
MPCRRYLDGCILYLLSQLSLPFSSLLTQIFHPICLASVSGVCLVACQVDVIPTLTDKARLVQRNTRTKEKGDSGLPRPFSGMGNTMFLSYPLVSKNPSNS